MRWAHHKRTENPSLAKKRKTKVNTSEFTIPEDTSDPHVAECPVTCWAAEIRDGECLSRELDRDEYKMIRRIFADFYYQVNNENLVVAEETPEFDSRAAEFIKFAEFDEEILSDAKANGIAVFFENSCKPSMIVCRKGFLFNDPAWTVDPGATNISSVPWSLFTHFAGERCDADGNFALMQNDEYAKSTDVYDESRAKFDNAMQVHGNRTHKFNFTTLGFKHQEIEELFAKVKQALTEVSEGAASEENLPSPDDSVSSDDEVWG